MQHRTHPAALTFRWQMCHSPFFLDAPCPFTFGSSRLCPLNGQHNPMDESLDDVFGEKANDC